MLMMLSKATRAEMLTLGIASLVVLTGCASPQRLLRPIEVAADHCGISVGRIFTEVKACLDGQGVHLAKVKYPTTVETWEYRNSGRGDTPLTASVAWIRIKVDASGLIADWKAGSQLDGA